MTKLANEFCILSVELLEQSMLKLRNCLNQLEEDQIWWRPQPSLSSVGNLCLHLCGNLRQWGIVPFTGDADMRQRESEFDSEHRVAKAELLQSLESVVNDSKMLWSQLDESTLLQRTVIQGFEVSFLQAISHTSSHFVGHTHQIITLTRMQRGDEYKFQWTPDADRGSLPI